MPIIIDTMTLVTSLQIVVLLLLLVGVSFSKGKDRKRSLFRHGLAVTAALALHMTSVLVVMIPSFYTNFLLALSNFSVLSGSLVLIHVITGSAAPILAFIIIASWRFQPISKMACAKRRRLMTPTFFIWTISLLSGIFTQLSGTL